MEYAIKGVVMALDGRVNQRHNSRELAHHLQRRGEDVGMAQLDDVEPQKGRTPTPYEEFENPEFKDLSDEQTARILRAAETIVGNCERRVEELAREHPRGVHDGPRGRLPRPVHRAPRARPAGRTAGPGEGRPRPEHGEDARRALGLAPSVRLVVRHVIIFGHGHGLQRAIIDESQHRAPERLIMAQH